MNLKDLEKSIRDMLMVSGSDTISLHHHNLEELPNLSDIKIESTYSCSVNNVTSLKGSPHSVGGYFFCYRNKLKNLVGAPRYVGGDFDCEDNPLESLEGLPEFIGGEFIIDKETWDKLPKDTSEAMYLILNNKVKLQT